MEQTVKIDLQQTADKILSMDDIIILTHANPDGDCIGSACALYMILKKLGKNVKVACPSAIPQRLLFITEGVCGEDIIETAQQLEKIDYDLYTFISVDVASGGLLCDMEPLVSRKIKLAIDHHEINTMDAEYVYVLPTASATGEIIYDILQYVQVKLNKNLFCKNVANAIYAAVTSDTGCFCFSNTTAKTHMIASKLIECGAQAADINHKLFEIKTKKQFDAEKRALDNMRVQLDGKLIISYITNKELEEIGAQSSDTDTCVQVIKKVEGCEAAVFIKQKEENVYKASVRTNKLVDAAQLCKELGGGGHKRAAGCTVEDNLEKVIERITNLVKIQLENCGQ